MTIITVTGPGAGWVLLGQKWEVGSGTLRIIKPRTARGRARHDQETLWVLKLEQSRKVETGSQGTQLIQGLEHLTLWSAPPALHHALLCSQLLLVQLFWFPTWF